MSNNTLQSFISWMMAHLGQVCQCPDVNCVCRAAAPGLAEVVASESATLSRTIKLRDAARTDASIKVPADIDGQIDLAVVEYLEQLLAITGCELLLKELLSRTAKMNIPDGITAAELSAMSPGLEAVLDGFTIFSGGVDGIAAGVIAGELKSEVTARFDAAIASGRSEARSYLEGYGLGGVADLIEAVGESAIDSAERGEDGQRALAGMIISAVTAICPPCGVVFGAILALGSAGWIPDPGGLSPKPDCMEWTRSVRDAIQSRINAGMPKPDNFDRCLNDGTMQRVILGGMKCPDGCENYYHAYLNGKC